ncbi:D-inositol-3-phosphate glycosyltransferase [Planctomycetes bacterium Pla163]|uniref:D-inositol-3-phosphate glycosyltransferase n=1 Tax=Rohdeia mirabilis TaxID=2528008 RepID=A0A518D381_9BACT|nr:D-inositol-3-phosphate glycosyltransferase [Planctomycetes bacterium Pla163]
MTAGAEGGGAGGSESRHVAGSGTDASAAEIESAAESREPLSAARPTALRLLMLCLDERLASSRLRVIELAPALAAAGARVEVLPYPRTSAARRALATAAREADVVLVQKRLPSFFEALGWRHLGAPVVFDFDDAIRVRQKPVRGSYASGRRRRALARALGSSAAAIVGNEHLARTHLPEGLPRLVAPTAVPLDVARRQHGARDRLSVGWVGGSGNFGELERVTEPLRRALAARPTDAAPVELVVVADRDFEAPGLVVRNVRWSAETQGTEIASFDVGLMPLADNPWNRGKCAYKLLQYMAAEVPSIASPVGMNADVVEDGVSGLLAAEDDQWCDALGRLLADEALRERLGRAGRAVVDPRFGFEHTAASIVAFLSEVVATAAARSE